MTDGPDLPPPRRPRPVLAGTEALINEPRTDDRLAPHLTTGAGIAIAGIWLAAAGLTALLVMVAFVWAPERVLGPDPEASDGFWLLVLLLALPMLAGIASTRSILGFWGKDD